MKIAITGHRPLKLGGYDMKSPLVLKIRQEIEKILDTYEPEYVITGMALGIDQLLAQIAIEKNIPFIAAIPDTTQPEKWNKEARDFYYGLLRKAVRIMNVTGKSVYKPWHLQIRNEWMVDQLDKPEDRLIAVWDGTPGGTRNTMLYAEDRERTIIRINPKELIIK